jgi:hypothetical protein
MKLRFALTLAMCLDFQAAAVSTDQSFAPPGWNCWWQYELDAGRCEPLPGWTLIFDPVLHANILVRPQFRALDIEAARGWEALSPQQQHDIKTTTMPQQTAAADLKYALECGATESVPADRDPDPVFRTRIAKATTGELYVVHYAASGETYVRNDQYRDLRFWSDGKTDNWSGVSIKRPDWTMVGRLQIDKTDRWVEYIEKL